MEELELIIFDLAGTTVEDHGEVPAAFAAALAGFGIEVTPGQIKNLRGASKRQAILQLLPAGPEQSLLANKVYAVFQEHIAQRYAADGVHAIPGAVRVFESFRERGVRVALNTGFDREITTLLLGALGWNNGSVDAIVCGEDVPCGRPAPYLIFQAMERTGASDVHKVASVGDTTLDLQAGYHAGVRWNIGVLSGAHDRQSLEKMPHTRLFPSVAEVISLWP